MQAKRKEPYVNNSCCSRLKSVLISSTSKGLTLFTRCADIRELKLSLHERLTKPLIHH